MPAGPALLLNGQRNVERNAPEHPNLELESGSSLDQLEAARELAGPDGTLRIGKGDDQEK